jgi:uncharacterized protein (DUF2461 family)
MRELPDLVKMYDAVRRAERCLSVVCDPSLTDELKGAEYVLRELESCRMGPEIFDRRLQGFLRFLFNNQNITLTINPPTEK